MSIAREGLPYILIPAAVAVLLLAFDYWYVAAAFVLITAFMAYFFRDPHRDAPQDPYAVVAPADGRVTRVRAVAAGVENSPTLVSIFLSPLDVHINRAPIAGVIADVSYTRGKFLMATDENASLVNEQNAITIEGDSITVVCKQIAGILARRIVCWKVPGEQLKLGERFGLIKFSSRTDVLLPDTVEVLATEGMRVRGGVTIIGRIK
ncbi:MAG: phosphatidylserine decarboxylase [Pyrinomonadaceae bacterium]